AVDGLVLRRVAGVAGVGRVERTGRHVADQTAATNLQRKVERIGGQAAAAAGGAERGDAQVQREGRVDAQTPGAGQLHRQRDRHRLDDGGDLAAAGPDPARPWHPEVQQLRVIVHHLHGARGGGADGADVDVEAGDLDLVRIVGGGRPGQVVLDQREK